MTTRKLFSTAALATGLFLFSLGGSASAATCPSFRVLHDDKIGPASLPAGNYTVTTTPAGGLSCSEASSLFTRFLQDWDGVLPAPWKVVAEGSGKASFKRGSVVGFRVQRGGGGGGGGNNAYGALCRNDYTVNAGRQVGSLYFKRGSYVIYLPPRSGITCQRATNLFTRFLSAPTGTLPAPWRLTNQTGTFYKPENPTRSAFRIEPA